MNIFSNNGNNKYETEKNNSNNNFDNHKTINKKNNLTNVSIESSKKKSLQNDSLINQTNLHQNKYNTLFEENKNSDKFYNKKNTINPVNPNPIKKVSDYSNTISVRNSKIITEVNEKEYIINKLENFRQKNNITNSQIETNLNNINKINQENINSCSNYSSKKNSFSMEENFKKKTFLTNGPLNTISEDFENLPKKDSKNCHLFENNSDLIDEKNDEKIYNKENNQNNRKPSPLGNFHTIIKEDVNISHSYSDSSDSSKNNSVEINKKIEKKITLKEKNFSKNNIVEDNKINYTNKVVSLNEYDTDKIQEKKLSENIIKENEEQEKIITSTIENNDIVIKKPKLTKIEYIKQESVLNLSVNSEKDSKINHSNNIYNKIHEPVSEPLKNNIENYEDSKINNEKNLNEGNISEKYNPTKGYENTNHTNNIINKNHANYHYELEKIYENPNDGLDYNESMFSAHSNFSQLKENLNFGNLNKSSKYEKIINKNSVESLNTNDTPKMFNFFKNAENDSSLNNFEEKMKSLPNSNLEKNENEIGTINRSIKYMKENEENEDHFKEIDK